MRRVTTAIAMTFMLLFAGGQRLTAQESDKSAGGRPAIFHLSICGSIMLAGSASGDISTAFRSSGFGGTITDFGTSISYPDDEGRSVSWGISADFNVLRQLQLGFSWNAVPEGEIHGIDLEMEKSSGEAYGFMCTYVFVPEDSSLAPDAEFSIAAGVSYNIMKVGVTIRGAAPLDVKGTALGYLGSVSLEYYFSRYLSIQFKLLENYIPSPVHVEQVSYTDKWGDTTTLLAHTVNFSRLDVSVGFRLHL